MYILYSKKVKKRFFFRKLYIVISLLLGEIMLLLKNKKKLHFQKPVLFLKAYKKRAKFLKMQNFPYVQRKCYNFI